MLLIVISIMLVIMSSWSLANFIRLHDASKQYKNDTEFENACHLSKKYVKYGFVIAVVMLVISIIIMGVSLFSIYRNYN